MTIQGGIRGTEALLTVSTLGKSGNASRRRWQSHRGDFPEETRLCKGNVDTLLQRHRQTRDLQLRKAQRHAHTHPHSRDVYKVRLDAPDPQLLIDTPLSCSLPKAHTQASSVWTESGVGLGRSIRPLQEECFQPASR
uniref:uncharacterized protein LOC103794362 n=1 Tax=Callithrix jacchus TaxID=9483 RepID=UPI0023DCFE12|nr:uncharacterized protein LOC103794362 [Callithrix jacchus]